MAARISDMNQTRINKNCKNTTVTIMTSPRNRESKNLINKNPYASPLSSSSPSPSPSPSPLPVPSPSSSPLPSLSLSPSPSPSPSPSSPSPSPSPSSLSSSPMSNPSSDEEERARMSRTSLFLWHTRHDDVTALRSLLRQQNSSLVSAQDYDGRTPLHVAAFYNCLQAAAFLLAHGAPVNAQDRWGNSPLADAQGKGNQEMEKLLRDNGGQILGNHGARLGTKAVAPPLPQKCDWEIDPEELDFSSSMLIGKGGFGEIWRAMWRSTPVAIKKLLPSLSDDSLTLRDFRNEVELLVKLRHPNVVQFLGAVTRKPLMLVTEYLGAGDLHSYLKEKGALPAATALSFAQDIARGMIYLHNEDKCIIHRDLKPRNLLLLENNHVKVADFGLSKIFPTKKLHQAYVLTGETGSYRYMAPEVFLHRSYDTKVDVFSFAMILYEMFEGESPLSEMVAYEAAKSMARDNIRPKLRAKTYPAHMKELIQKCWSKNPNDRPSFKDILMHLEKMEPEVLRGERGYWPF